MLFTNEEEIRAYLPTSVWSGADSLLSLMEETEETQLVPILGEKLHKSVCESYAKAMEEQGGVVPKVVAQEDVTPEIRLIRCCQLPLVYLTLANSTGILGVNLNEGGGLNQSYTEMFDKADKDAVSRFERDAWFKGHRGIDRLLLFLESDARSQSPRFAGMWKESRYFYLQGNLLFTTASCMNRYLDIGDSREKFISMVPDIRYCQDAYLAAEMGEELIFALVEWCTRRITPEGEGLEETDRARLPEIWDKAVDRLRVALALYIESRRPEKQRRYSENEASLALMRARKFIAGAQQFFMPYIASSPLHVPPPAEADKDKRDGCGGGYDFDDPDNALFVFFPNGLNRH